MQDIAVEFKSEIIRIIFQYAFIIINPLCALGLVWVFGRMLGILKTDLSKNILAIIAIIGCHTIYQYLIAEIKIFEIYIYTCLSIVFYVAFCWRLYYRMDSLQDKKIGDDKKFRPTKKVAKK